MYTTYCICEYSVTLLSAALYEYEYDYRAAIE
jgi:hypothetical protein